MRAYRPIRVSLLSFVVAAVHLFGGVLVFGCTEDETAVDADVDTQLDTSVDTSAAVPSHIVKVLPLGDSITQGQESLQSYRYPLWKKLIDAQWPFDMVGSMDDVYEDKSDSLWPDYNSIAFDVDHEGHWGWRVRELKDELPNWMGLYPFDVVLLHGGTNDLGDESTSIEEIVQDMEDLIDILWDYNPQALIILAKIIPISDPRRSPRVPIYNEALENAFEDVPNLYILDMYSGFDAQEYLVDHVHPNELGEDFMAQKWAEKLFELEPLLVPSIP